MGSYHGIRIYQADEERILDAVVLFMWPPGAFGMAMAWKDEYLDLVLVPIGFIIFLGYHLLLLYKMLKLPETTSFGSELHRRRLSIEYILQMEVTDRGTFMAEMSSSMALVNTNGSYSATLISVVGVLATISFNTNQVAYGNNNAATEAIKCSTVIIFALVAFFCFQEGAKTLGRANFLITMPDAVILLEYINEVVVRGFVFCEVGNRSFYFSLALLPWFFGPILMLAACLVLVLGLYMKDMKAIPSDQSEPRIELSPI